MVFRNPILFLAGGLVGVAAVAKGQSYIGAERCKSCHEFEYRQWSLGPHAKAHAPLSAEQRADPKCNTCHTMLPETTEARYDGVQCERCHGPGRYYHRRYVMRDRELSRAVGLVDPKPEHCRQCHTEGTPSVEPFEYEAKWRRIDHGRRAHLAWEKARVATGGKSASP
jgi:hypothetical protein